MTEEDRSWFYVMVSAKYNMQRKAATSLYMLSDLRYEKNGLRDILCPIVGSINTYTPCQ